MKDVSCFSWYRVSTADFVFAIIMEIAQQAGSNVKCLVDKIIHLISGPANSATSHFTTLSKPLAFAISRILSDPSAGREFICLSNRFC